MKFTRVRTGVVLTILGAAFWGLAEHYIFKAENTTHNLIVPERRLIKEVISVSGTVVPSRSTTIFAPFDGYVLKVFHKVGSRVRVGSPLVAFGTALNPNGELFPIRAPFDGTVVQILRSEGEYVETSKDTTGIIRVDNLDRLFVIGDFRERDIPKIDLGHEVKINPAAFPEVTLAGKVFEIAGAASSDSAQVGAKRNAVLFRVKMEVTEKSHALRSGMTAFVSVVVNSRQDALTLPLAAVKRKRNLWWVRRADGTDHQVEVGILDKDRIEITSGLSDKDQVVNLLVPWP